MKTKKSKGGKAVAWAGIVLASLPFISNLVPLLPPKYVPLAASAAALLAAIVHLIPGVAVPVEPGEPEPDAG